MIESGQTEQKGGPLLRVEGLTPTVSPETLQDLFNRAQSAERLKVVLNLLATTLAQSRFAAAASAFVTELATRLGCDRVSYGVVRRRRVTVRALSHSAHFTSKSSLFRHMKRRWREVLDQRASVALRITDVYLYRHNHPRSIQKIDHREVSGVG